MPATRRRSVNDAIDNTAQRLNVRIDPAAYQRLMIHCVMSGTQPGKFLATLIDTHCRTYRVQVVQANRSASVPSDGRLEIDASMSEANANAA
jgi:hypothetical protein